MPAWSAELAAAFAANPEIQTEQAYKRWFLRLCGVLGDAVAAKRAQQAARAADVRIPNPYSYKPAFRNRLSSLDLRLLQTF